MLPRRTRPKAHGVGVVSYPDPNVRNDDHRLQYDITYLCTRCHTVSDDHYIHYITLHLGLGTRLGQVRKFSTNCPYINFLSKVKGLILRFMSFIVYFATSFAISMH